MADEQVQKPDDKQGADEAAAAADNAEVTLVDDGQVADKKDDAASKNEEEAVVEESEESEAAAPDYGAYENPALKQAVKILTDAKISIEDSNAIFAEAINSNDISKIDRKALVEKLGEDKADMVLALAENYYTKQFATFQKVEAEIVTLVGNKETFDAMKAWAQEKEKTDKNFAKDMEEIRQMFNSNTPRSIKAAAQELFSLYKADPKVTIKAKPLEGDARAKDNGISPLTRKQYTDMLDEAAQNGTYDKVSQSLWARRQAGIKQGI